MQAKFTCSLLLATLVFSGATTLTAEAQTNPTGAPTTPAVAQRISTIFRCVREGNGFATIAQRGTRVTPPVITWNAKIGQYTPQKRCNIVSQKLTDAVAQNGGKFKNLQLLAGPVNNQAVICVINKVQSTCNSSNTLFTLGGENAARPDEVIAKLRNFSRQASGTPISESFGLEPVPLEGLNRFLEPEDKTEAKSSSFNSMPIQENVSF